MAAIWQLTPRRSIEAECQRRGRPAVVCGCIDLLQGRHDDVDDALVLALGEPAAQQVLGGAEGGKAGYWPRVWAARGLPHAWDDRAAAVIIAATADQAWRVRAAEFAARVQAAADGRPVNEFEEVIERDLDRLPRVGLWVDPSGLDPQSAVDLLLDRRAEAVWMVNAADPSPATPGSPDQDPHRSPRCALV